MGGRATQRVRRRGSDRTLVRSRPGAGLDRPVGWAERWGAWGYYRAGSFASGLWLRGEWTWIKDREPAGTVIDVLSAGTGPHGQQGIGTPFSKQGITGTIGLKFADAKFCSSQWLKQVELLARYDQFQKIETASAAESAARK